MNTIPTTEDRIWAVISHLSALAFGMGIVLPIIGWSDQRRKSNYASFQSLQALGYQSLGFTVWILSCLVLIILVSIIAILGSNDQINENPIAFLRLLTIIFVVLLLGFFAPYFLLPMIAAVSCALGRDFRYPFMGNRLARYLGYNPARKSEEQWWLNEDHEFRWVASMGHFSILIALWGMLAPLAAWLLYGKHSFFLKFQSIQTVVYQAGTTILYFVGLGLYSLGSILFFAGMRVIGEANFNSFIGIVGILVFGPLLLITFLIILVVPLLHILGQWAGYRVLKGDNYHYPFVGRWVEKRISKNSTTEERLT